MKELIQSNITIKGLNNGILYHYTDHDSFKKIIRSKQFLLSNYSDLRGDKDELVWAFNTYSSIIKPIIPKNIDFSGILPQDFYVFSTCIRENNKYLWENYADSFTGVAIGIHANSLYDKYNIGVDHIHMSPMDYDNEKFIDMCKQSICGLKPIPIAAPVRYPENIELYPKYLREYTILDMIPGYREFANKRHEVLGYIALQKGKEYKKEEEYRIVHSPIMLNHKPFNIKKIKGINKAALPLTLEDGHFISEVIITPDCKMTICSVKRHLKENGILTNVRIIETTEVV